MSKAITPLRPSYLVTTGKGGDITPDSIRVRSLATLHQQVLTEPKDQTKALLELWHPWTETTRQERYLQHRMLEAKSPYFIAGHTFDRKAYAADEDDPEAGWQKWSGLVALTFKYTVARGNEARTTARRLDLEVALLAEPLLGPSIVFMYKIPAEGLLVVLIAVGSMPKYHSRVHIITRYLRAANPKLYGKEYGYMGSRAQYPFGFDPLAFFLPEPEEGYTIFPTAQAKAFIKHRESQEVQARFPSKRQGWGRSRYK